MQVKKKPQITTKHSMTFGGRRLVIAEYGRHKVTLFWDCLETSEQNHTRARKALIEKVKKEIEAKTEKEANHV